MSKRLSPTGRRQMILDAALAAAYKHGYSAITREQIAREAGVAPSLVSKYFGTIPKLRHAVLVEAIRTEDLVVVLQGLEDYIVVSTPDALLVCRKHDEQKIKTIVQDLTKDLGERYC